MIERDPYSKKHILKQQQRAVRTRDAASHLRELSVRALVYHEPKREKLEYDFTAYDFVIATYHTIECHYRKYIMPEGKKCTYGGKKYSAKSMKIHLRYYCGPHARLAEKQ